MAEKGCGAFQDAGGREPHASGSPSVAAWAHYNSVLLKSKTGTLALARIKRAPADSEPTAKPAAAPRVCDAISTAPSP